MQNRKTFLKTAAIGVAGAIGLTLIPSKALAETIPPLASIRFLRYLIFIRDFNFIAKFPHVNKIEIYTELHNEILDNLEREMKTSSGEVFVIPIIDSYTNRPAYRFECDFTVPFTRNNEYGINWFRIDRTMKNIIEHKPDPFMEYPYVD